MSTKPKLQATKKLDRDLATFKQLPEQTKERMKLKDEDERTSGPDQAATTRAIQDETRKSKP